MPSIRLSLLSLAFILSSCAYFVEGSFQDVTVLTPGAHGALCMVNIDGLNYRFYPPETIAVTKSKKDMVVDCKAPGNRRKKIIVEPDISALSIVGAPGAPWDYASEAMFKFPDVIEVDFTDIPVTAMPLPAQNNPDIKQPEAYYLEEFSPGRPRMNADRHAPPVELKRRGFGQDFGGETEVYYPDYGDDDSGAGDVKGKGDLMKVIGDPKENDDAYGPAQNYPVE